MNKRYIVVCLDSLSGDYIMAGFKELYAACQQRAVWAHQDPDGRYAVFSVTVHWYVDGPHFNEPDEDEDAYHVVAYVGGEEGIEWYNSYATEREARAVCDQLNLNIFRGVDKPPRATDHDHRERQAVCEAADRGIYE